MVLGVVGVIVAWLLLSLVLFLISAQTHSGGPLVAAAEPQLSSGGPMLTSANTILILGLDNRPTTGQDSKEGGGANTNEADANTDTIMLWRVGGGVSRRLSIPRDTLVNIPGHGQAKINAAWAYGGPALALKVIKQFTGLQINHLVVIDLANFRSSSTTSAASTSRPAGSARPFPAGRPGRLHAEPSPGSTT